MQRKIKFSVIIPVYNTNDTYLNACMKSILSQNYDNYEIVMVNDGSNYHTSQILEDYRNNNKVINLINQENKGIVGARLTGINNAKGEYIYFLDSDDLVNDKLLLILDDIVNKYNPDIILHDSYRFSEDINHLIDESHYLPEGVVTKKQVVEQLLSLHINGITNKCAKRVLFEDMENNIDLSILNGEDLQQSTYIINKANTFYQTYEKLEYYRMHDQHSYYDFTRISELNYLIPTYKMMFENTNEYFDMLHLYKQYSINSIIYNVFNIIWLKKDTNKILDNLNNLEIIKILSSVNQKIAFSSQFVFNLLINKQYFVLKILALIYKLK